MGFDVAADAYDRFMGRYSTLLSPQLADLAGIASGQRVGRRRLRARGRSRPSSSPRVGAGIRCRRSIRRSSSSTRLGARNPGVDVRLGFRRAAALRRRHVRCGSGTARRPLHERSGSRCGGDGARDPGRAAPVVACVWDHGGGQGPLSPLWDAARALDPEVVGGGAADRLARGTARAAVQRGRPAMHVVRDGALGERRASDVRGVVGSLHVWGGSGRCLRGGTRSGAPGRAP